MRTDTSPKMKHLAAYLLLGLGGNTSPSAEDVKGVLSSVGIDADEERLDKLIKELEGKDLQELIQEGSQKLASVPSGGGGGGAGGAAAPAAAAGGDDAAPAAKPAEKEEEKEESDEDMGFGLFD
ncbi:MAG: hypothetical protein Q9218_003376 [Villophora microphyllina]